MADALNPVANIYQGFWIDWSYGKVWGWTLTLCPTHSTILTNSLAMFVAITGMQLWTIISYFVHQYGSSIRPDLATPHLNQQQRVLRNAGSALSTARYMAKIAWKSRKASGRFPVRAWSIGVFALIYAIAWMLAGTFSNKAVVASAINGGSPSLLRNSDCGVLNQTYYALALEEGGYANAAGFDLHVHYLASGVNDAQHSLEYAQECYLYEQNASATANEATSACHTLKQSSLHWATSNTSCPFSSQICHNDSYSVKFETDVFDSNQHFGINAKPQDRLTYQRRTVCAVLNPDGYIKDWDGTIVNSSSPKPASQSAHAYYGYSYARDTNWTYEYSNFASFYDNFTDQYANPYQLEVQNAYGYVEGGVSYSDYEPIPEFDQTDSDLILFFLSYVGMYIGPVTDPWFSALKLETFDSSSPVLENRYSRATAISTIGCEEQHQFCTNQGICTGFLGFEQVQMNNAFNTSLTSKQQVTFNRLLESVVESTIARVVENIQGSTAPLLASNEILGGRSGAVLSSQLPSYQWVSELQYWHSISMAHLQRLIVQWATGQSVPSPEYLIPATESDDVWFCNNMVVPSSTYQSFRASAIILIIVFGCFIIVASIFVQELAAWIRKRVKSTSPSWHWDDDDLLGHPGSGRKSLRKSVRKSFWKPTPPPKDFEKFNTINRSPQSVSTNASRYTDHSSSGRSSQALVAADSKRINVPSMQVHPPPIRVAEMQRQEFKALSTSPASRITHKGRAVTTNGCRQMTSNPVTRTQSPLLPITVPTHVVPARHFHLPFHPAGAVRATSPAWI